MFLLTCRWMSRSHNAVQVWPWQMVKTRSESRQMFPCFTVSSLTDRETDDCQLSLYLPSIRSSCELLYHCLKRNSQQEDLNPPVGRFFLCRRYMFSLLLVPGGTFSTINMYSWWTDPLHIITQVLVCTMLCWFQSLVLTSAWRWKNDISSPAQWTQHTLVVNPHHTPRQVQHRSPHRDSLTLWDTCSWPSYWHCMVLMCIFYCWCWCLFSLCVLCVNYSPNYMWITVLCCTVDLNTTLCHCI